MYNEKFVTNFVNLRCVKKIGNARISWVKVGVGIRLGVKMGVRIGVG